jgi:hypothetical protein
MSAPWPAFDARESWEQVARTPHGAAIRQTTLQAAAEYAQTPGVRPPTLTEFLAFARTGDRRTWEAGFDILWNRLGTFALAACFTGETEWVERTADALWAICELTTWTTPAHENKAVPEPDNPTVDLWSAMLAQEIAEMLQVLGGALDRIDPRIQRRARAELDRRVFAPFLARSDWWWLWQQPDRQRLNNWTAVCSGSVLCAALAALDADSSRQARIVHKAAWSLGFFKDTFDTAGSLDEGAGYWAYGFSYYVMAAERLATRTQGTVDLLADPFWREVAQFPLRVHLYGDTFVNFSDCATEVRPVTGWMMWLGRRLDVPGLVAWAARLAAKERTGRNALASTLRTLFWLDSAPQSTQAESAPPLTTYLPDVQWLIARSSPDDDALILAAKGGHNAENHNHNDGGSLLIHYQQEALVAELGAPTYTRQFFSSERYENIAARSLGHSVPLVNGQEQQEGREFAAQVIAEEDGRMTLELSGLYPSEAGLVSLQRTLALQRQSDSTEAAITLSDRAHFAREGGTLALPLITLDCRVEVSAPGHARILGQRGQLEITWEPAQAVCHAEDVPTTDPKFTDAHGATRIHRLWFEIKTNGQEARLDLTLVPTPNGIPQ